MSVIDLIWYLNITDQTKYLVFISFFVCILLYCIYRGKKKSSKKGKKSKSLCQKNYDACVRNNIAYGTNNYCFPCDSRGAPINFVYDEQSGQLHKNPY